MYADFLALVILAGAGFAAVCQKFRMPRIIGMLIAGIILGPYVLNLLDDSILAISADLREMALVIILIKAGLSLSLKDLKAIGRPAVLMAFLPAAFEIAAFALFAPAVLGISRSEAAIMGAVLGAVSPAVVVPRMVQLLEERYGTNKRIPQMILAGASLDDVFVIILFEAFIGMAQGADVTITSFSKIPVSIVLGIGLGAAVGMALTCLFESSYARKRLIKNSMKVIVILGTAFGLLAAEDLLSGILPVSGLLAVISMAMVIATRSVPEVTGRLREKYGKIWILAEIVLFVLVGAAVDIRYTFQTGIGAVWMLAIGLFFRSAGVALCTLGTGLNIKERLYCVIAYLPRATVQAAIGAVPLSLGLSCGNIVLSVAVLSILITAPLGAIGMDLSYQRLLTRETGQGAPGNGGS